MACFWKVKASSMVRMEGSGCQEGQGPVFCWGWWEVDRGWWACCHLSLPDLPDADTDSDSDLSLEDDQSGSYASTHSSDSEEEEEEEAAFPGEQGWDSLLGPGAERLPLHSTPKGGPALGLRLEGGTEVGSTGGVQGTQAPWEAHL